MNRPTIMIAGGGTGGHVFPGLAVAEAMRAMADVDVVFCGTERGIESTAVPARGFRLERLHVEPIKGGGPVRVVRGGVLALAATVQSFRTVRELQPRVALSTGGYAAGPVTLAAALLGVPIAVLEPNSSVGLANTLLGTMAKRAYVAWEGTEGAFRSATLRRYGVPLRPGFVAGRYVARGTARVLVMGGSQGAAALNERMPAAIAGLAVHVPHVEVLHQAGRDRDEAVRAAYAQNGVTRAIVVPFIDDVARAIADADVVVARGGAGTIAVFAALGRASVLVPFPHAADDHQAKNAAELARSGAAVCLRQEAADSGALAACLRRLLSDPGARFGMAEAARSLGRPTAAYEVAADLLALARVVPVRRPLARTSAASAAAGANGRAG